MESKPPEYPTVLFVVPALNEEKHIGNTITSIRNYAHQAHLEFKIAVADHGSSDQTPRIAEREGAIVFNFQGGTVAGLRNKAVAAAGWGSILVFIDADVTLTHQWAINVKPTIDKIHQGARIISGSHCSPPDSAPFWQHAWFGALATDPRNTHVGTGHMIVSRTCFEALGGFAAELRTGEDYDFCVRALNSGISVENNVNLPVVHHDFPPTVKRFIKREAWHGLGDLGDFSSALRSKVILGAALFMLFHVTAAVGILFQSLMAFSLSLLLLGGLLLGSAYFKFKHTSLLIVLVNSITFYIYYAGRSLAIIKRVIH